MKTIENGFGGSVHDGVPASMLTSYRGLLATTENLLIPQLWTGRRQLFHISQPLLRHSLGTLVRGCRSAKSWCDFDLTLP